MDPPRVKPKLLNKALLADIASTVVEKQLRSADRADRVAELYMLDKRFRGNVLRNLEKCDSAQLSATVVTLDGPTKESSLELEPKLFGALLEHSGMAIPKVVLAGGFRELSTLKVTGVESLNLVGTIYPSGANLDHLVRVITENKCSLKALLTVPQALFGRLPWGLALDEFSTCDVKPRDVKIPALNAKVFTYDITDNTKIPLAFMRTVNAEEIHLEIDRLLPGCPKNPFGAKTANYRTKKLRVEIVDERVSNLDFARIFREVSVCFPKLECFELFHEKVFKARARKNGDFTNAVDELVAGFERAMKEADTARYKVHLKSHVWYSYDNDELTPAEADFKCGLLQADLPPSKEVEPGKQHAYFVKEISTNRKNLRMDCEIVEGMKSDDESVSDYDYDGYEDYYDYEDPYDSDGHFRGYDDDYYSDGY